MLFFHENANGHHVLPQLSGKKERNYVGTFPLHFRFLFLPSLPFPPYPLLSPFLPCPSLSLSFLPPFLLLPPVPYRPLKSRPLKSS